LAVVIRDGLVGEGRRSADTVEFGYGFAVFDQFTVEMLGFASEDVLV
jgi:hypothetical protein